VAETTSTYLAWTCGACKRPIRIVPEPAQPTRMCRCTSPVQPLRPTEQTTTVMDGAPPKRLREASADDELAALLRSNRHVQVTITGTVEKAWFEGADRRLAMVLRPGGCEPPIVVRLERGDVVVSIEQPGDC
jgi:hypothetical protein